MDTTNTNPSQQNIELYKKFNQAFESNNPDVLDEYISQDVKVHTPEDPLVKATGLNYFKEQIKVYGSAFPKPKFTYEKVVADNDSVAAFFTIEATNTGSLGGSSPTNKEIKVYGSEICRFENGKLVEYWGLFDALAMLQQIGLIPAEAELNANGGSLRS